MNIKPFSEWAVSIKWASVSVGLAGLVLLGDAISSIPIIEPYFMATRGYARYILEEAQAADKSQRQEVTNGLRDNTVAILDLKMSGLDGQISALDNTLRMLELRMRDTPGDQFLIDLKSRTERDKAVLNNLRREAYCQKWRAQYDLACPTPGS